MANRLFFFGIAALAFSTACSGGTGQEPDGAFTNLPNTYTVQASGESTTNATGAVAAAPGDPVGLSVDIGGTTPLAATAQVAWYGPAQIAPVPAPGPGPGLPTFGNTPTGILLSYPPASAGGRSEVPASVSNMLFVLDEGTGVDGNGNSFPISINAQVSDPTVTQGRALPWDAGGLVPGSVNTGAPLTGDPVNGAALYGANCAACHGAAGAGSPATGGDADAGLTYTLDGDAGVPIPAPALAGTTWTQGTFVFSTLVGIDDTGVILQEPMPIYLGLTNAATGQPFSNQDISDIYAFLTAPAATGGSGGSIGTTGGSVGTTGGSVGTTGGSTGTTGATTASGTTSGATTGATTGSTTGGGTTGGASTGSTSSGTTTG